MEILEIDAVTGKKTSFVADARKALRALKKAEVPFAVIGATALAVRGLPRMTKDLDVVVSVEDKLHALDALRGAGFSGATPVDLLVAGGEPESTVVAEAPKTSVFGVTVPTATLEHLVLMYLYSNQVRHQGDLARIVVETKVDLAAVERYLAEVHAKMLPLLRDRVHAARHPAPAPARPRAKRKRS